MKAYIILPAYNAEKTLDITLRDLNLVFNGNILLVDDASSDRTLSLAKEYGIETIAHTSNRGYGGNQKTCYREAIERGAEVVLMLHPDYQYSPRLVPAMLAMIESEEYDVVLGSRVLAQKAYKRGMPIYKYCFNRILTAIQNLILGTKLSEFHTGFRAYRREVLQSIKFEDNSEDFVFDNEFLAQIHHAGWRIGEISCPTRYSNNSSSISFIRSVEYGIGVLKVCMLYFLHVRIGVTCELFKRVSSRSR